MSRLLKVISSILLLLLLSTKTYSQSPNISFTTDDCITSKGCFRFPETCTTSENCDFLITYNATSSDTVEFELSGADNWIAVGFSDDQLMPNTDILMCVSDNALSGHYYAVSKDTPQQTIPTLSAVSILEEVFENNRMKCRVSRKINPGLTNFKDLNNELFLLAAYGPVESGEIQYHTARRSSTTRVRLLEAGQVNIEGSTAAQVLAHGILMTLAWTLFASVMDPLPF